MDTALKLIMAIVIATAFNVILALALTFSNLDIGVLFFVINIVSFIVIYNLISNNYDSDKGE